MIEVEDEVAFHHERLDNPARLFVDLKGTRPPAALGDTALTFPDDDAVAQIRVGRHPQNTTRIVMDFKDVSQYTLFTLYQPYRIVIDCERRAGLSPAPTAVGTSAVASLLPALPLMRPLAPSPFVRPFQVRAMGPAESGRSTKGGGRVPIPSVRDVPTEPARAPVPPSANLQGGFSMARQLGLSVARIVIDPGHGGHDPGATGAAGVVEASLVLDVALRLEKLLLKQPGVNVVLTRRTDVFVPLEERTAMANRENADLFLSIHANASHNSRARGVETYFLNFATNQESEAVAARENLTSSRTMNSLPDIVRAITLNTKVDESRDFATIVQQSMVQRLRAPNKSLRDLGVKQAPFVVLIGASMPSVLAEISFVTNKQEAALLKGNTYRQRIAQALLDAIVRYQKSLKAASAVRRTSAER
jgi:N-acetylmuramoyl-L-alanine amidase